MVARPDETLIPILTLDTEPAARVREQLNPKVVRAYAALMRAGRRFPPVVVCQAPDGKRWVADGRHRTEAARLAGRAEIAAALRPGSREDALRYAAGANA